MFCGRALALGLAVATAAGCGDTRVALQEVFPPGTDLKVFIWDDGVEPQATLHDANDRSEFALTDALDAGRTVKVWIFPFSREQLGVAVPGLANASIAEIMAGVQVVAGGTTRIPGDEVVLEARFNSDALATDYTRTPRAMLDASPERPPYGLAVANDLACRTLRTPDVIELPSTFNPLGITAVDADRVFIAGSTGTVAFQLLDVTPTRMRRVRVNVPGLRGPTSALSWESRDNTLWGRDNSGRIYRIGPDGQPVDFAAPPTPTVLKLSAGRDGSVVAIGQRGPPPEIAIPTHTYDPARDTWSTVADLFNTTVDEIRAYGRDRYMGHLNCWTRIWEFDPDQGFSHWGKERAGETSCRLNPRDITLDASRYYFLSSRGDLQVGDAAGKVWTPVRHEIAVASEDPWPEAMAAMEDARFAVAGDRGQLEVWIGDRWCVPPPPTPTVQLALGAGYQDTAWFVGTDHMGTVRAVRVRVGPAE